MADASTSTKLAVIGAGPGGYPAAFLAAEMGMDVTLIDLEVNPGGECLYRGCIPSKSLLHVARLINEAREAEAWGLKFEPPAIDLEQLRQWKQQVVGTLTGGLGSLSKARKVTHVQGRARLADAHSLTVTADDGGARTVDFDAAIVATGSRPIRIPTLDLPGGGVMDSTDALQLADVPNRMLVIGGGYIGLEMGTVYAALGSKVTAVEMTSGILPGVDRDLAQFLAKRLDRLFEAVMLETKVVEMSQQSDGIRVKFSGSNVDKAEQVFDKVLVAVGRRPNSEDLGLEHTAVKTDDQGFIVTDAQRRTDEANIYAIGDVAGQPMLAHKATYEARIAVNAVAGKPAAFDARAIPAVVFTDPEIAWCGVTETDARNANRSIEVSRFPWAASGRATTLDRNDGLTKLILEPRTERILGVGIAGVGAGELIAEGVLAIEMGAVAEDLQMTIHAHPTLSETMMEAADLADGFSPHYIPRKS